MAVLVKNQPANAGDIRDLGLIPGLGRAPGGGHVNPLQYSCLENPHGQRSLVGCSLWGPKVSDTTECLRTSQVLLQFPSCNRFRGGSDGQESACNAGDTASILGWGRSPGGNGNPLQYSCLENSMDRGAWPAPVQRVAKSQT